MIDPELPPAADPGTAPSGAVRSAASFAPGPGLPDLHLPKGGGAVRGIGEKFVAGSARGTGAMTIPVATSPGRGGFGSDLELSYDSGSGNGPFGFGWSLSLPTITRKTDQGLPRYLEGADSDVFLISGADELVPVLVQDPGGQWQPALIPDRVVDGTTYRIRAYRPRVEGLFSRIERWTNTADSTDSFWRSISSDNVTSWFGRTPESRIVDPADASRIFSWLVCETHDDRGDVMVYGYQREDSNFGDAAVLASLHERNRTDESRSAQLYPKRIRYGNRQPYFPRLLPTEPWPSPPGRDDSDASTSWHFELVLDYGDHDDESPSPSPSRPWPTRPDPFSSYRPGFELRTYRTCMRFLMFHHFPDEPGVGSGTLVESTDLTFDTTSQDPLRAGYTLLTGISRSGYRRTGGGYERADIPALELQYSTPSLDPEVRELERAATPYPPVDHRDAGQHWVDLLGDGAPGLLTEAAGTWTFERNLSPLSFRARLARAEIVARKPTVVLRAGAELVDLAGDGLPDVLTAAEPGAGVYRNDGAGGWHAFRPFPSRLTRARDGDTRLVDLDGNGIADLLVAGDDGFSWHESLGEEGFGPERGVTRAAGGEQGPQTVFDDGVESVHLADMSGDGLADLVCVHNGEVCYWPNLGHGRFGARVAMDHAPTFDLPDLFDSRRLRLADIDGSGTTDVIYLHRDGLRLYTNRSGNEFGPARVLPVAPRVDDPAQVVALDLLGNGTTCLSWSSHLSGASRATAYIDLFGGRKPYLLVGIRNNLGAETIVEYAPSTTFLLRDLQVGRRWMTRLPFPVHVVEKVTTLDHISGNRFVTRYAYHHGCFDGAEREFRGFGMVEQWDAEELAVLQAGAVPSETEAAHLPPVLTKTWYHTGAHLGRDYDGEAQGHLLADTVLPAGLTSEEEAEARRALSGRMLRQEVYGLDATDGAPEAERQRADRPYSIVEQNFALRILQPHHDWRPAVFLTQARERLSSLYERRTDDPRVSHVLTLEVDRYGNVLREVDVAYGRHQAATDAACTPADHSQQSTPLLTYRHATFTRNELPAGTPGVDHHRVPLPAESTTYELTGFSPAPGERFSFDEWHEGDFALLEGAEALGYEEIADPARQQKRIVDRTRTRYRRDDLSALSAVGAVEAQALPGETYRLALTPALLTAVLSRPLSNGSTAPLLPTPSAVLEGTGGDQGGYVFADGGWWAPSGREFFDPGVDVGDPASTAAAELASARSHFYLPRCFADAFGQSARADYDAYDLLITDTSDAVGNTVRAVNDYRVLAPWEMTDANGNRSAVAFDLLGLVVASAIRGKAGEPAGDRLDGIATDPDLAAVRSFLADPLGRAAELLADATQRTVYDVDRYRRAGQPIVSATLSRETHVGSPQNGPLRIRIAFTFTDGFGREVQQKLAAEPGEAPTRSDPALLPGGDVRPGDLRRDGTGALVLAPVPVRWVGSGRTVHNNKGLPVVQYEPFFSTTHLYETEAELTDTGVGPVFFYDPLGRVVTTLRPDHTYEKTVFSAWERATYDQNDTSAPWGVETGDPRTDPDVHGFVRRYFDAQPPGWETWRAERIGGALGPAEQEAAQKAADHAGTPTVVHLDPLGRAFLTIVASRATVNGAPMERRDPSRVRFDIEGNVRVVRDAVVKAVDAGGEPLVDPLGRVLAQHEYDMLGNLIRTRGMEDGDHWTVCDAAGNPGREWNARGFERRFVYDALRRPASLFITEDGMERLVERTVYGEAQGAAANHRGRAYQVFDDAGIVTNLTYDFKGNLLRQQRDLLPLSAAAPDWEQDPVADDGTYTTGAEFDALNRQIVTISPDASSQRVVHNEAGLAERIEVHLRGAGPLTVFLARAEYNAKGQRVRVDYGNGITTRFDYDPRTFRLVRQISTRPTGPDAFASQLFVQAHVVQDLRYTYDPVGNITRIENTALATVIHGGHVAKPVNSYSYDALYRLVEASGREHAGQNAVDVAPPDGDRRDFPFVGHRMHANDLQALRPWTRRYEYDAASNLEVVTHRADRAGWTRRYSYEEVSRLEPSKLSNRLSRTSTGNGGGHVESYRYDPHGNPILLSSLGLGGNDPNLVWDASNRLVTADLGGGGTAHFVHDASGVRVRKVIVSQAGRPQRERLSIGGLEVYREYVGDATRLERESLHIMDGDVRVAMVETTTVADLTPVQDPAPAVRFQLGDHLASSNVELDPSGAVIGLEEFHPYGTSSLQAGRSAAEVSLKRYRFAARERDEETGFIVHGVRLSAPWLGRWISADPAGLAGGANLYLYCAANPIGFVDDSGLAPQRYEDQRRKDTAAKAAEMRKNLAEQKSGKPPKTPDPMQKRAADLAKKRGKTPIEQHHHKGVQQAAEVKLDPKKMGDQMSSVWSTKADPKVRAGIGDKPVWDPDFKGDVRTHHNVAKELDFSEQAKGPKTAQGLESAAEASKQRLPATVDMTERAKMDWTRTEPKGPPIDPKTGLVKDSKALKNAEKVVEKAGKAGKAGKVALKLGKAARHFAAAVPIAGIVAGHASAAHAASTGDYQGALLDEAGHIPVAGDLIDAGRGGIALGEALEEAFGISDVAAEHGALAEAGAKRLGLGEDASLLVGATGAAISSITIAPSIAVRRTIAGWFQ